MKRLRDRRPEQRNGTPVAVALILAASVAPCAPAQDTGGWNVQSLRRTGHYLDAAGLTVRFSYLFEFAGRTHETPARPGEAGLADISLRWQPRGNLGTFTAVYNAYSQTRELPDADLQGVSNLAAPAFHRWREAYWERSLGSRIRVKAGKVDANSEFAVIEHGSDLSNASAGVSPTLFTMPSYPDGALSANIFVSPLRDVGIAAGVYRSAGGGVYSVAEAGARWTRKRAGRIAFGVWTQRAQQDAPGVSGSYAIFEQTLVRAAGGELNGFARVSLADAALAPASLHNVFGLSWTGFGRRQTDSAGFAFLRLLPSLDGLILRAESVYEAYYKLPLRNYLEMKADFQHVRLGGTAGAPSCFAVASVRLLIHSSIGRKTEPR